MTRPSHAILIAILIVLLIGVGLVALPRMVRGPQPQTDTATTTPVTTDTLGWKIHDDATATFQYPEALATTYIHATDWPPMLTIATSSACETTENEMGRTGPRVIDGANYCVTELAEGAAGSTYTTYTYVTQKDAKNISLMFTLRSVQCLNYDDPQKTECLNERNSFSVDDLVAKIVGTVRVKP